MDRPCHTLPQPIAAFEKDVRTAGVSTERANASEVMAGKRLAHQKSRYCSSQIKVPSREDRSIKLGQSVLVHSSRDLRNLREVAPYADIV